MVYIVEYFLNGTNSYSYLYLFYLCTHSYFLFILSMKSIIYGVFRIFFLIVFNPIMKMLKECVRYIYMHTELKIILIYLCSFFLYVIYIVYIDFKFV